MMELTKKSDCFSFPADDELKRKLWFASLPNVVKETKSKKICTEHWPDNFATIRKKGHDTPRDPPSCSIFLVARG